MTKQSGITLIELVLVLALAALVVVTTAAYSVPWLARETMRGAMYDVQTAMQTTRIEAVSRNRPCRFVINTDNGSIRVFDTMGTGGIGDDTLLHEAQVPSSVSFARPDAGAPVTLTNVGGNNYAAVFAADGTVNGGTGEVCLFGGDRFGKISLYAAGGLEVQRWNGAAWETGL